MGAVSHWVMFLTVFLCIYGAFHLYFLVKARRAFRLTGLSYTFLLVMVLFLFLAPIQARVIGSLGYATVSMLITWIGYLWMGFIFLFVCVSIPLDGYHLLVTGIRELFDAGWSGILLLRRQSFMLASTITIGLMVYGAVSAYQVRIEHLTSYTNKIPADSKGIRIVQISDLHLGLMSYPGRLAPLLAAIRAALPDVLVCTGDLVDGPLRNEIEVARTLKALPAPLGKFAVTGNHEYYAGIVKALDFIKEAGFQVLNNESVLVNKTIIIAGVEDATARKEESAVETKLLAPLPADKFILLLKHRPEVPKSSQGRFDLQLSGHTHNGQIFPFNYLVQLKYPMMKGLFDIGGNSRLYVNRGTGTWGPPLRIFSPSELTIIDLLPAKKKATKKGSTK